MIRSERFPDGADDGIGPLVVLYLTGPDRHQGDVPGRVYDQVWVSIPNTVLTNGAAELYLGEVPPGELTARLHNEVLRARDWCTQEYRRAAINPNPEETHYS